MSRANTDLMDLLHGIACEALVEEIKRAREKAAQPRTILDDDGNPVANPDYEALNPQLIDKALKMLKDNAITAPASNKPANDLASELQDLDFDDPAVSLRH